jgi:hypothetical protein
MCKAKSYLPATVKSLGLLVIAGLLCVHFQLFAAKGGGKEKKGYVLKFDGFDMRSAGFSPFSLRHGVTYHGSFNTIQRAPLQTTIQSLTTYRKGNSIFIYPYRHKLTLSKFKTPEKPAH